MIIDQVIKILTGGERLTIPEIARRIPDFERRENADEILKLSLRLDKCFEQDGDKLYFTDEKPDPKHRIFDVTAKYFQDTKKKGELLNHLAILVSQSIGEDINLV